MRTALLRAPGRQSARTRRPRACRRQAFSGQKRDLFRGPDGDDRVRLERLQGRLCNRGVDGSDDCDLSRGREVEVERRAHGRMRPGLWGPRRGRAGRRQPRAARDRRRRRSAPASAARRPASRCPKESAGPRDPSCARRALLRRRARGRSRPAPRLRRARRRAGQCGLPPRASAARRWRCAARGGRSRRRRSPRDSRCPSPGPRGRSGAGDPRRREARAGTRRVAGPRRGSRSRSSRRAASASAARASPFQAAIALSSRAGFGRSSRSSKSRWRSSSATRRG